MRICESPYWKETHGKGRWELRAKTLGEGRMHAEPCPGEMKLSHDP